MKKIDSHALSVATVGTKGQIVIPLEVRDQLGLKTGDKVVLMVKDHNAAILFPIDGIRAWLDKMTQMSADVNEMIKSEDNTNKEGIQHAASHLQA